MKTNEDVERLKSNWSGDPCWDLSSTEGFEEYAEELAAFQSKFERQQQERFDKRESREAGLVYIPQHRALIDAGKIQTLLLGTHYCSFRMGEESWDVACENHEAAVAMFDEIRLAMIRARRHQHEEVAGEIDALYGTIEKGLRMIDSSLSSIHSEIFQIRRNQ